MMRVGTPVVRAARGLMGHSAFPGRCGLEFGGWHLHSALLPIGPFMLSMWNVCRPRMISLEWGIPAFEAVFRAHVFDRLGRSPLTNSRC